MTSDTQPDRVVSSIASLSDQTRPEKPDPSTEKTSEASGMPHERPSADAKPTNAFEGFGSFSC